MQAGQVVPEATFLARIGNGLVGVVPQAALQALMPLLQHAARPRLEMGGGKRKKTLKNKKKNTVTKRRKQQRKSKRR